MAEGQDEPKITSNIISNIYDMSWQNTHISIFYVCQTICVKSIIDKDSEQGNIGNTK